jgi:Ca-activated chloride channel homolog
MDDDLNELKQLFREEPVIAPRKAARDFAITEAVQIFEKNLEVSQGSGFVTRLTKRVVGIIRRRDRMHSLKLNHMLMAGTSVAVLAAGLVLVLPQMMGERQFAKVGSLMHPGERPEPIVTQNQSAHVNVDGKSNKLDQYLNIAPASVAPKDELAGLATLRRTPAMAAKSRAQVAGQRWAGDSVGATLQGELVDAAPQSYQDQGHNKFLDIKTNPVKLTAEEPVSTFSIDADSASYSFVRGSLAQNVLPQADAVRVEEMINYFPYDYAGPSDRAVPFKSTATVMQTPWNPNTKLLHIGIKGFSLDAQQRPHSNLVFLLDTSGSMDEPNKLPLLRSSMKLLLDTLSPDDTVSIVTYAGSAGTVLEPTKAGEKARIIAALDNLDAGGSTAGAEGIRQAYNLAEMNFDKTSINRVILATDGDFNVGITDPEELKSFVERKRETGIYLSVLGFGRGNYNDEMMQVLAQNGNGNAAYIDTLNEARKVLVDEASSTLFPIAKDVKIQVEFNPHTVSEYRLIGYETRMLNREDFNNDKVDAGEIGAGHTVTALYEVTPKGSAGALVDPLRYGSDVKSSGGDELAFVKIRYKLPKETVSKLISEPVTVANEKSSVEANFAAAVAGFGQLLHGGHYTKAFSFDDVIALAQGSKGKDEFGYRTEFINLVRQAKTAEAFEPLKP